jgi:hypothetical protein
MSNDNYFGEGNYFGKEPFGPPRNIQLTGDVQASIPFNGESTVFAETVVSPSVLDARIPIPVNLLLNPSFDNGLSGWTLNDAAFETILAITTTSTAGPNGDIEKAILVVDPTEATNPENGDVVPVYNTAFGYKLDNSGSQISGGVQAVPSSSYVVSAVARLEGGGEPDSNTGLYMEIYDSDNTVISSATATSDSGWTTDGNTGGWYVRTATIKLPSNAMRVAVRLEVAETAPIEIQDTYLTLVQSAGSGEGSGLAYNGYLPAYYPNSDAFNQPYPLELSRDHFGTMVYAQSALYGATLFEPAQDGSDDGKFIWICAGVGVDSNWSMTGPNRGQYGYSVTSVYYPQGFDTTQQEKNGYGNNNKVTSYRITWDGLACFVVVAEGGDPDARRTWRVFNNTYDHTATGQVWSYGGQQDSAVVAPSKDAPKYDAPYPNPPYGDMRVSAVLHGWGTTGDPEFSYRVPEAADNYPTILKSEAIPLNPGNTNFGSSNVAHVATKYLWIYWWFTKWYSYTASGGSPNYIHRYGDGVNYEGSTSIPDGPTFLATSPDNKYLFSSNYGDKSVSSYSVGDSGVLTLVTTVSTGDYWPGQMAVAPNSGALYVVCGAYTEGGDTACVKTFVIGSDGSLTAGADDVDGLHGGIFWCNPIVAGTSANQALDTSGKLYVASKQRAYTLDVTYDGSSAEVAEDVKTWVGIPNEGPPTPPSGAPDWFDFVPPKWSKNDKGVTLSLGNTRDTLLYCLIGMTTHLVYDRDTSTGDVTFYGTFDTGWWNGGVDKIIPLRAGYEVKGFTTGSLICTYINVGYYAALVTLSLDKDAYGNYVTQEMPPLGPGTSRNWSSYQSIPNTPVLVPFADDILQASDPAAGLVNFSFDRDTIVSRPIVEYLPDGTTTPARIRGGAQKCDLRYDGNSNFILINPLPPNSWETWSVFDGVETVTGVQTPWSEITAGQISMSYGGGGQSMRSFQVHMANGGPSLNLFPREFSASGEGYHFTHNLGYMDFSGNTIPDGYYSSYSLNLSSYNYSVNCFEDNGNNFSFTLSSSGVNAQGYNGAPFTLNVGADTVTISNSNFSLWSNVWYTNITAKDELFVSVNNNASGFMALANGSEIFSSGSAIAAGDTSASMINFHDQSGIAFSDESVGLYGAGYTQLLLSDPTTTLSIVDGAMTVDSDKFVSILNEPEEDSHVVNKGYLDQQLLVAGKAAKCVNKGNSTATLTLDLADLSTSASEIVFTSTANVASIVITFSNPPATGTVGHFSLLLFNGLANYSVTFPSSIRWANGTLPILSATLGLGDRFVFETLDGGTTYYGYHVATNIQ